MKTNRPYWLYLIFFSAFLCLQGCQTTQGFRSKGMAGENNEEGLKSVAEAMGGKKMSDKEARDLAKKIENDPEAKSAVESIKNSLSNEKRIKYCPSTGKRYAGSLEYSPECDVKLEWLE